MPSCWVTVLLLPFESFCLYPGLHDGPPLPLWPGWHRVMARLTFWFLPLAFWALWSHPPRLNSQNCSFRSLRGRCHQVTWRWPVSLCGALELCAVCGCVPQGLSEHTLKTLRPRTPSLTSQLAAALDPHCCPWGCGVLCGSGPSPASVPCICLGRLPLVAIHPFPQLLSPVWDLVLPLGGFMQISQGSVLPGLSSGSLQTAALLVSWETFSDSRGWDMRPEPLSTQFRTLS